MTLKIIYVYMCMCIYVCVCSVRVYKNVFDACFLLSYLLQLVNINGVIASYARIAQMLTPSNINLFMS